MRKSLIVSLCAGSLCAAVALLVFASAALSQGTGAAAQSGSQPFDPHDLTGVWSGMGGGAALADDAPMTPAGLAFYRNQQFGTSNPPVNGPDENDPLFKCEPSSTPRNYFNGHPFEIDQTPTRTLILYEAYRNFRIIYTDGRKQPDHNEGTWYGDSIGHWEGNTLVVDTTNFNGRSWIDEAGHPESAKARVTERFTRPDHDHLRIDITVDDPVNYTKPWSGTKLWVLRPTWEIEDYMCSPSDVKRLDTAVTDPANANGGGLKK